MGGGAPHTARRGTAVTDQYGGPTTREAGWLPDPGGRHQYRYHDGLGWTDHVSTNGQQRRDPLPVAPPPPPAGPAWGASANSSSGPVPARDGSWPAASGSHWPDQPTPPGGVTMGEAVRRVLGNYAQFKGRAPRSEYWWFVLAMWLLLISVVFVGAIAGLSDEALDGLSMLAVLALLLPHLAVMGAPVARHRSNRLVGAGYVHSARGRSDVDRAAGAARRRPPQPVWAAADPLTR
jgi:hypothetical protein